jgi:hypothetical protein
MGRLLYLRTLFFCAILPFAAQATTIVPGGFANTEAPSDGISPLSAGSAFFGGTTTGRWQQIYASSEFIGIPSNQGIVSIAFRDNDGNSPLANISVLGDIRVSLTTTNTAINGLSATFANNLNASTTQVYSGPVTFTKVFDSGSPRMFQYLIELQTPYFYVPADGNLLLDITVVQGNNPQQSSFPTLDYARGTSPVMSAVLNYSGNTTDWPSGTIVTNSGWPTQFVFAEVPEPGSMGLLTISFGALVLVRLRRRQQ